MLCSRHEMKRETAMRGPLHGICVSFFMCLFVMSPTPTTVAAVAQSKEVSTRNGLRGGLLALAWIAPHPEP